MAGSGYQGAYGNPAWGPPPSGGPGAWGPPPGDGRSAQRDWPGQRGPMGNGPYGYGPWGNNPWHPSHAGRVMPIVAMILGFIFWWPVGLAILGYMAWSGRMGCWSRRDGAGGRGDRFAGPWAAWRGWCNGRDAGAPTSSGNRAFDEYRADTLRRLEQEQQEFGSFLDRLRFAKDKAEFDQFMAERRQAPPPAPEQPAAS